VVGAPELGAAIITGGQTYAQSNFMRFSRGQEQAADQAGVGYLDRAGISSRGMAEFFRVLEKENVLAVSSMSPYLQSHPLTRDRINFVDNHVASSPIAEVPPGQTEAHARMVAKLQAFLNDPRRVLQGYDGDQSLTGRYARAIALYRLPDLEAAIEPYRESVRLAPGSPLLEIGLARALVETGGEERNREAIGHLENAMQGEPTNAFGWRLLGIVQGREGEEGLSNLSLAEYALLIGKTEDARLYARRAEGRIDPSDPAWLRLQDVLRIIEES
jgi:predicted Zn-dependent protease